MNVGIEALVAGLLVASGILAVLGALGIVRLRDYYTRLHAPALGNTLGAWCACAASIVQLSFVGAEVTLQPLVLNILLPITAPITTVLLARAALFRNREAGRPTPPPLAPRE